MRRFALRVRSASLATGIAAVVLLLLAEFTFAVVLQARPLVDYITSRDPVSGGVYLTMLLMMALMPWLLVRRAVPVAPFMVRTGSKLRGLRAVAALA